MSSCLLTNQNSGRMVAVHGNSCVEVRSSKLQALNTPLKRVFLRSAFERIYGAFTRHFCAPFPVLGLLTCKRLTIIFRRIWRGLKVQVDSMNTIGATEFIGARLQELLAEAHLATILVGEQLNALELILEATILNRDDSYSRAILCQTSNLHCEFRELKQRVNELYALKAELLGEG